MKESKMEKELIINHDGDTWRVLSTGAYRDGMFYCHLLRIRPQKNSQTPIQIGEWISSKKLQEAENSDW